MDKLLVYGNSIIMKYNLKEKRQIINTNVILEDVSNNIYNLIKPYIIDIDMYNITVHRKINIVGHYMKPHVDDCVKVQNKNILYDHSKYDVIYNNTYLYHTKNPIYSVLYYCSDFGVDFTGGKLVFADGMEVLPKKGMIVIFDSREVHLVTPITSGTRESWLIKLYKEQ